MSFLGGADVIFYVAFYAFVSATMLVANKWALNEFPYHHLVMLAQFASTALFVRLLYLLKVISPPDEALKVDREKIIKFIPIVVWFYLAVMTNLAAMKYLSVDLVTLIRTCIPFLVAFGDYVFLGRSLPSAQSWFSLVCLAFITAIVFVREPAPNTTGLIWGATYYFTLSASMIFTKKFIADVKMTVHDRVFWNNVLCIPPGLPIAYIAGDITAFLESPPAGDNDYPILSNTVTCLLGIAMAYAGWLLRARVSALTFTLIGVLCKIGSITINAIFLDHLALRSMILIGLGIIASMWYEEPKARPGQIDVNATSTATEKEKDIEAGKMEEKKTPKESIWKKPMMVLVAVAVLVVAFWENIVPEAWVKV